MKAVGPDGGGLDASTIRKWKEVKRGFTTFQEQDVLFAKITPCMENGKVAVASGLKNGIGAGSTEFHVFRPTEELDSEYLYWFLMSPEVRSGATRALSGAVGQQRVPSGWLKELRLPVPEVDLQRSIARKISDEISVIHNGDRALRLVQANLKTYRASVLKAACEGRLVPTEAELARQEGRDYETGPQLLNRILETRRKFWNGKGKYKEPVQVPQVIAGKQANDGWCAIPWEGLLAPAKEAFKRGPFGSAIKKSMFVATGFLVYEQSHPISGDLSRGRYFLSRRDYEKLQGFAVEPGDYLISCAGTIGRIAKVGAKYLPGVINQALLRVRINETVICPAYFELHFNSPITQNSLVENSTGSAMVNLKGVDELKAIPFNVPPLPEQLRIVAEVERRLSVIDQLETTVTASLQRATRLRQSILHKAFTPDLDSPIPSIQQEQS